MNVVARRIGLSVDRKNCLKGVALPCDGQDFPLFFGKTVSGVKKIGEGNYVKAVLRVV